ncbi:MAG: sigma-70 family RNA polymerase sigma factor [Anaerolineales bacterium]|nr:sigma-70 family RNA polymerase sigma factor [Chloroflexota bacterium]MBL6979778.1 sigma-70 family RNA polymerase sigma factor [Anaerolineales bacterium]
MPNDSDRQLVQRSIGGETKAYGMLVQQHQNSVFNVCYRMLGEYQHAEDLTQDTFIRAYQRLDTFDLDRPYGPWIRRIATNLCLNHLNKKQPTTQPLEDELIISAPSHSINPERAQEHLERKEVILQALLELPPHYRTVIELRHYQDMNYQEIAETLDLSLNTAKSHLFRARKLLAKKLENLHEYV